MLKFIFIIFLILHTLAFAAFDTHHGFFSPASIPINGTVTSSVGTMKLGNILGDHNSTSFRNYNVLQAVRTAPSPNNFLATAVNSSYVSLTWDHVPSNNVFYYQILRGPTLGSITTVVLTTINNQINDTTVVFGNDYYYEVRAVDLFDTNGYQSNYSTAPQIVVTRNVAVKRSWDSSTAPFPGSSIVYSFALRNIGFGPASVIELIDVVPTHTVYSIGTVTGSVPVSAQYKHTVTGNFDASESLPVYSIKLITSTPLSANYTQRVSYNVVIE
jgi:uncharacterized repeat protein (TIGR01451 family)